MIEAKLHEGGILSLCDKELIGKILAEGDIEIKVSESFYKGENYSKEMLEEMAKNARNINAIGKESIDFLIKLGIIDKENVRFVNKVPFALVFEV